MVADGSMTMSDTNEDLVYKSSDGMIVCGDCEYVLGEMDNNSIDIFVTSPPYGDIRTYGNDWIFNFDGIANQIVRTMKDGGVLVWIVGDETKNGTESGESFRQALYFMDSGLNLHDTMIWNKGGFSAVGSLSVRYAPVFEYMFVFSKGKIKTFNPICDRRNKNAGKTVSGTIRQKDGSMKRMSKYIEIREFGQRFNVWEIPPQRQRGGHPAPFPVQIPKDHILSWSNIGDTVCDPFAGSGTTGIAAIETNRKYILIEQNKKYVESMITRLGE
jgi:site-specific DNA-methyltransferase (adenine-specific)